MKFKDAIDNFRFVDNWYSYSVNLVLAQILHDAVGGASYMPVFDDFATNLHCYFATTSLYYLRN